VGKAKPFCIAKREVWMAYKQVKANHGAAGVDDQSIAEFEEDLRRNLYRIWNRMSSGSYFPPPVRRVDIPKGEGRTRPLGIPMVSDRIAMTVVQRYLEPILEPVFHEDSYGYRPGRSARDALRVARQRCWRYDWVPDVMPAMEPRDPTPLRGDARAGVAREAAWTGLLADAARAGWRTHGWIRQRTSQSRSRSVAIRRTIATGCGRSGLTNTRTRRHFSPISGTQWMRCCVRKE
jgi:hypothetical protein